MSKIITLAFPVLALVLGFLAGDHLRPRDADHSEPQEAEQRDEPEHQTDGKEIAGHGDPGYFTFPTQFFVPLIRNGDMGAIMILTLSVETAEDQLEAMKTLEHRLRDALLRQLMIHANTGGFDGNFTTEASLGRLRADLLKAAQHAITLPVRAILIEDIARQSG